MVDVKFLVDECLGVSIVKWLTFNGYDVKSILREIPGATDHEVLKLALDENRVLITHDKDFGYIVFQQKLAHSGIILFRLMNDSPENRIKVLDNLLKNYIDQLFYNYVVVSENNVKIIKTSLN